MFRNDACKVLLFLLAAWILPVSDGLSAEITVVDGRQWTAESNGKPVMSTADQICDALELGATMTGWCHPSLNLHHYMTLSSVWNYWANKISSCCVWSSTTLLEKRADDSDGLQLQYYRWGFMFDGGQSIAVHILMMAVLAPEIRQLNFWALPVSDHSSAN